MILLNQDSHVCLILGLDKCPKSHVLTALWKRRIGFYASLCSHQISKVQGKKIIPICAASSSATNKKSNSESTPTAKADGGVEDKNATSTDDTTTSAAFTSSVSSGQSHTPPNSPQESKGHPLSAEAVITAHPEESDARNATSKKEIKSHISGAAVAAAAAAATSACKLIN